MKVYLKQVMAILLFGASLLLATPNAHAQFNFFKGSCINSDSVTNTNSTVCKDNQNTRNSTSNPITETINDAATIIAAVAAIFAVFMIMLGGFNLITSSGNAETVAQGRRRIIYSLVGLVIIALAWTITRFITDRVIQ